ncbi:MAG TPA: hypothetical protein VJ183_03325 [Chloroflexia bacterium]|nr:hypothetical protein [Chloroflexia bacterium]
MSDAHWYTVEDFDNSVNPPVHRFIVQKGPGEVTANSTRGKRAWGCPNQISAQNNAAIVAREYKELKDENNNFMHLDERVYGPDGKEVYTYGKLCQGNPTNCLAPPGVFCALYFYQPGIQDEKTFIFKSDASIDESINIQNYSGTLSCWSVGHTPSLVKDVGTDHKFGTLDEVLKLGVTFSRDIEPVSQYSLP